MIKPATRLALATATLLFGVAANTTTPSAHATPAPGAITSASFPRIANYDGFSDANQAPIFTRYGLVIAWDTLTTTDPGAIQALRSSSPAPTILGYERAAQVDVSDQNHYGTNAIYHGWWLLKAGSTLSGNINSSQTTISVASTAPFHSGDDVLVDSESMHVTSVTSSNKSITVQRGYYSTAASHNSGARIATHAYLDTGGSHGGHPWAFNMSSDCPKNSQGQKWVDFLANWLKTTIMPSGLWNGVFFDNTNDKLYDSSIDVNNDGSGDGGFINGVNVWQQGIASLFSQIRADFPGDIFMGNGSIFSQYDTANGQELYSPDISNGPVKYNALVANYHYHMTANLAPQVSLLDPATPSGPWNLQLMRFGLTTALLDNGLYTYDKGATQNGTPWWFDEYDNGAGTALTSNAGSGDTQLHVAHGNLFHSGDTVIVEGELMQVTGVSSSTLNVTRGYNGTTTESHDAGAVVATPQQVQQGVGYLGQPLGPAYTIGSSSVNLIANGGFDLGTLAPWQLGVGGSARGTMSLDTSTHASGPASAKIAVTTIDGQDLDIEPQDANFALAGGQNYAVSFSAKSSLEHNAHLLICSSHASPNCIADAELGLRPTWTTYTVNFAIPQSVSDAQVKFGLSDATGTSWLDSVSIVNVPQPVQRRDFANGTVLVNPSASTQTVALPGGYCHLHGDQNPSLNNGNAVSSVSIPSQDGVILRRCSGGPGSTPTPIATPAPTATPPTGSGGASGSYSGSIASSGGSDSYSFKPNASGSATAGSCSVSTGNRVALYVYNSTGGLMGSGTASSYCNWVNVNVSAGQTYTVKTVATSGTGDYRSSWNVNGAPVTWNVTGSISASGAKTTFSFPILGTGKIALSTCGPSGATFGINLLSASGATLASSMAHATCQSLTYSPKSRDLYRLQEVSIAGTGSYAGAITTDMSSAPPTPTNTPAAPPTGTPTATPTSPPGGAASGSYSGSIASSGGSDSYSFTPGASGSATIGMCATNFGYNFTLKLYAGGALLGSSSTSSYCQWINTTLSSGRGYTVQTTAVSGSGLYRSAWSVNGASVVWNAAGTNATAGASNSFSFPTLRAGPLRISTCGPAGTEFHLALAKANGTTVASATAHSNCQSLSYTVGTPDLFHMVESSVSGSGPYSGSITM